MVCSPSAQPPTTQGKDIETKLARPVTTMNHPLFATHPTTGARVMTGEPPLLPPRGLSGQLSFTCTHRTAAALTAHLPPRRPPARRVGRSQLRVGEHAPHRRLQLHRA